MERIVRCPLSSLQIFLYNYIKNEICQSRDNDVQFVNNINNTNHIAIPTNRSLSDISNSNSNSNNINLLVKKSSLLKLNLSYSNILMLLRKLCNHPYLLLEGMGNRSIPDELYDKHLIGCSGKLCVLDRLLNILLQEKHKVIFSI